MRVELPIIDDPDTGLCVAADIQGNGEQSLILISTACGNNYISETLYSRLNTAAPEYQADIVEDGSLYYLADLAKARPGVIKELQLPGCMLEDVRVVVTPSYPAYGKCDMVLGLPIIHKFDMFSVNHDTGLVVLSDKDS